MLNVSVHATGDDMHAVHATGDDMHAGIFHVTDRLTFTNGGT